MHRPRPGARLRDIASKLGITERAAYGIVMDLTEAEYVIKDKHGRRNRYAIQTDLPLRAAVTSERTIAEVLDLLVDTEARRQGEEEGAPESRPPARGRRGRPKA